VSAQPEEEHGHDSTDHDERVGLVVADRYRIARVLGVGGMGGVYEAEHLLIGKKVALKCLHREYARDRDIVERFKREARAATLIGNDHIIDVTDMGDLPDGAPFLVMEYLAGKPLAAVCEQGPMPIRRCVHIARQICSALGAAHDKGIVHRDLKPENVFLVERNGDPDFVKVLDFGISKMHSSGVDKGLTRTGMAMGTPSYMSPEQAQGSKSVDHRTDIWALGVILYEMLAARRPFDADSYPLLLMNIVATDPDPIAWYRKDLPPGLADLVMRCLIKDQGTRVGSMRELSDGLAAFEGIDVEVQLGVPDDAAPKKSAEERFKATALARKKAAATAPDGSDDAPRTTTQPDGSVEGPPPVTPAQAEAEARRAKDTAREALPSEPRRGGDDEPSRIPAPTTSEVRALESQARSGNVTTLVVAGVALVAVVGIGIVASSGAFGGSSSATPPPTTGAGPATPPETDPPRTPTQAPPETVRMDPPQPVQAPPAEVRIRIRAEPADATIHIGDVEFPNPMDAPQPRSLTPVRIRVAREGYRTIEQLAIFGEDQSFVFQLARGRGVEQRPLASAGGRGSGGGTGGTGGEPATMDTSMTVMQIYEGAQGGFRDEF
jgi:serine/threonine-protein kinase